MLRKLLTILFCCCVLYTSAEAKHEISKGTSVFTSETIASQSYTSGAYSTNPTGPGLCGQWESGSTFNHRFSFSDLGGLKYSNVNYIGIYGRALDGRTVVSAGTTTVSYTEPAASSYVRCGFTFSNGSTCWTYGYNASGFSTKTSTVSCSKMSGTSYPFILKGCTTSGITLSGYSGNVDGGSYSGCPAINSMNITVTRGSLTDTENSHSVFAIGPDSEQQVSQNESTTITTVKLSNPPVIIDWADFPG